MKEAMIIAAGAVGFAGAAGADGYFGPQGPRTQPGAQAPATAGQYGNYVAPVQRGYGQAQPHQAAPQPPQRYAPPARSNPYASHAGRSDYYAGAMQGTSAQGGQYIAPSAPQPAAPVMSSRATAASSAGYGIPQSYAAPAPVAPVASTTVVQHPQIVQQTTQTVHPGPPVAAPVAATPYYQPVYGVMGPPFERHLYGSLGGSQGNAHADKLVFFTPPTILPHPAPTPTPIAVPTKFKHASLRGRLGLQLTEFIGVEGEIAVGVGDDTAGTVSLRKKYELGIYGVGRFPLTPYFDVFGRLGYAQTALQAEQNGVKTIIDRGGAVFGVGAEYDVTPRDSIRLDYTVGTGQLEDYDSVGLAWVRKF